MQIRTLFNHKSIRSYILVLLLVIVLIIITMYLSRKRLVELEKDKPRLGIQLFPGPDPCGYSRTNPFTF